MHVVRCVHARCVNEMVEELQAKVPYTPLPRVHERSVGLEIIDGFPLPRYGYIHGLTAQKFGNFVVGIFYCLF